MDEFIVSKYRKIVLKMTRIKKYYCCTPLLFGLQILLIPGCTQKGSVGVQTSKISCNTMDQNLKIDSITLRYVSLACMCPEWIESDVYDSLILCNNYAYQTDYYIEPITDSVNMSDWLCIDGNIIRFYGHSIEYKDTIWFPGSPPSNKFLYCGFKVIGNYKTIDKTDISRITDNGDTIFRIKEFRQ
jgi:hypothetical protein